MTTKSSVLWRLLLVPGVWLAFWIFLYPTVVGYWYSSKIKLLPKVVRIYTSPRLMPFIKERLAARLSTNLIFVDNPNNADVIINLCQGCKTPVIADIVVPVTEFQKPVFIASYSTKFGSYLDKTTHEIFKKLYPNLNIQPKGAEAEVFLTELYKVNPRFRILPDEDWQNALDLLYANQPITKTQAVFPITLDITTTNQTQISKKQTLRLKSILEYKFPTDINKVTITGVTAITRGLLKKLDQSNNHKWLIKKIIPIMKADIVHTSNEVSFVKNCRSYSGMRFCSNPKYFKIFQDLEINLIELTGNHNNDFGSRWNTYTIEKIYKANNIKYFGGGLNLEDASRPAIFQLNGTEIAFLGYNVFDVMLNNQGPLAAADKPGANPFNLQKAQEDIRKLHEQEVNYIIVHLQYQECYAYPKQYGARHPTCYKPIKGQREVFRALIDAGASIVVGTQAHQPQIFERYNNGFIFYGLGNFLFDQIQWPGTREGLILSLYFADGKLINIKITPIWQEQDYSIRPMTPKETSILEKYLKAAQQ